MEGNLAFLTYDVRGDNDHFETMIRMAREGIDLK
jgi:hypothetical protein